MEQYRDSKTWKRNSKASDECGFFMGKVSCGYVREFLKPPLIARIMIAKLKKIIKHMYWANFLHFYQPPTQKPYWVNKITAESYRPILKGLLEQKTNKITLNINGILLELFEEHGHMDVIDLIRELLKSGQIELTGSAKYHPLLPFLPEAEVIRQIELNEATLRKYFGDLWKRTGFSSRNGFRCERRSNCEKNGLSVDYC